MKSRILPNAYDILVSFNPFIQCQESGHQPLIIVIIDQTCSMPQKSNELPSFAVESCNPRTAGVLSHLRTAGGGGRMTAPQRTRKLRKVAKSGKRRSIGTPRQVLRKYLDHFLIRSNLRSQGVKKGQFFLKIGLFSQKVAIISITIPVCNIAK